MKNNTIDFNEQSIYNIRKQVEENAENGKLWVEIFNTDCDLVSVTSKTQIDATIEAIMDLDESVYMEREGRCGITILTQLEAENWKRYFHDAVAEMENY